MFVTDDGRSIPLDAPFTLNENQYPANWLRLASEKEKEAIGIRWKPDPEPVDHRFYWDTGIPKDLAALKTQWVEQQKQTAGSLLNSTDWYVTRSVESKVSVPKEVSSKRAAIRTACNKREEQILKCKSVNELASLVTSSELAAWPGDERNSPVNEETPVAPVDFESADAVLFS